jgi:hypothetical protein
LPLQLLDHVVDDTAAPVLRTEHDDTPSQGDSPTSIACFSEVGASEAGRLEESLVSVQFQAVPLFPTGQPNELRPARYPDF